ncbi:Holliday junction endonuclease [Streptomyces beihaiensis]|uniref:Holliday junction endonuclease n=1 Tax=Streptomyces beihaiensis TaxID=2984495 RepID=A0ABT3TRF2_9ACTN|nr:Holliday junction endonuclease [Streptomyces beihaiensis]MCX3059606.1 Holliday junction endonuclease [Streptomyces beihaiensis]
MTAPRVLGLDLSMTATGVCLPDGSTRTIKTNAKDGDRRLQHIVDQVGIALDDGAHGRDACDLVVMEEAPPGLKGPAIKAIHMVHGAIRLRLVDFKTPYAVVNPTVLKAYATGSTSADKTAMAMAAFKRTGREFADDNQCDAAWLRWAGLDWLGHPEFSLPAAQRDRLTKANWPVPKGNPA